MNTRIPVLLICTILLSACATRPTAPAEELGAARSAIESAEDAGAREHAPEELRQARYALQQAESARTSEDYPRARRLAKEAEIEARYAAFRARSARADAMISELQESNQALEAEIEAATSARNRQSGGDTP